MIFRGASAGIGAYNLSLQVKQSSISSIWVESGPPVELNSIKVGLGVHPSLYGDSQLRLTVNNLIMFKLTYINIQADNYQKTGCYNIVCPGFVQVNHDKDYAIGSVSYPTSSIGSTTKYIGYIKIKQDQTTGHWWLIIQTTESMYVGYWPKELFTHLSKGASLIRFGGETYAPPNNDSPPMGSGRLPREKFRNSGFMGLVKIINSEYNEIDINPEDMKRYTNTNSECYDLWYKGYEGSQYRQAFLYGGPGGRNCEI
ncbi:protein neprosin-like [Vicia villosa]|uniref:protein neprosin-like n=1 Tax=Vicia villosa TaxID=3911 RepID=UPI00273CBD0F|nr:protein neprosin-like [Vicia villosa]